MKNKQASLPSGSKFMLKGKNYKAAEFCKQFYFILFYPRKDGSLNQMGKGVLGYLLLHAQDP